MSTPKYLEIVNIPKYLEIVSIPKYLEKSEYTQILILSIPVSLGGLLTTIATETAPFIFLYNSTDGSTLLVVSLCVPGQIRHRAVASVQ